MSAYKMTHYLASNPKFKSPEYWDGYDIYDEEQFRNIPYRDFSYLSKGQFKKARQSLQYAQDQIRLGNNTDIRYQAGTEFNPPEGQLEDGSVVIIDSEALSRWVYTDPERVWTPNEGFDRISPPIKRPLSEYWANTRPVPRDYDEPACSAGFEELTYWEETMKYQRLLTWGVVVTLEKEIRALQPFSFNGNRYGMVDNYARSVARLPLSIGEVGMRSLALPINRKSSELSCYIDTFERVRGVDIIWPASGKKEKRKRGRVRKLGKLVTPLTGSA